MSSPAPTHTLSILVSGRGDTPEYRSHWAFAVHTSLTVANILHVDVLDFSRLLYQFERRYGVSFPDPGSEGFFTVAKLTPTQTARAYDIISKEPAPRNGRERCQDWVLSCLIALEAEEVIKSGTCEWVEGLVGLPARAVSERVRDRWVDTARG